MGANLIGYKPHTVAAEFPNPMLYLSTYLSTLHIIDQAVMTLLPPSEGLSDLISGSLIRQIQEYAGSEELSLQLLWQVQGSRV